MWQLAFVGAHPIWCLSFRYAAQRHVMLRCCAHNLSLSPLFETHLSFPGCRSPRRGDIAALPRQRPVSRPAGPARRPDRQHVLHLRRAVRGRRTLGVQLSLRVVSYRARCQLDPTRRHTPPRMSPSPSPLPPPPPHGRKACRLTRSRAPAAACCACCRCRRCCHCARGHPPTAAFQKAWLSGSLGSSRSE